LCRRAVRLYEQVGRGESEWVARLLILEGTIENHSARPHRARPCLDLALRLAGRASLTAFRARTQLGYAFHIEGRLAEAMECYARALEDRTEGAGPEEVAWLEARLREAGR
jgi:hypothetical protein